MQYRATQLGAVVPDFFAPKVVSSIGKAPPPKPIVASIGKAQRPGVATSVTASVAPPKLSAGSSSTSMTPSRVVAAPSGSKPTSAPAVVAPPYIAPAPPTPQASESVGGSGSGGGGGGPAYVPPAAANDQAAPLVQAPAAEGDALTFGQGLKSLLGGNLADVPASVWIVSGLLAVGLVGGGVYLAAR